ncbi:GGDEF domain-containing protein [Mesorhizobium sp. KR1-2]|uniref:GGDEF domain-containing protein n=1 Tax=Mesorhizobium sp. KR1-2 TaxID=3156609 RepID=UPI0032B37EEA
MTPDREIGLTFWNTTDQATRSKARTLLSGVIKERADDLVGLFYSAFLEDREASAFLSHSVVHERLSHSLKGWLFDLLEVDPETGLEAFDERQKQIGEIHARIKIPIHLVMAGASLVKSDLCARLLEQDADRELIAIAVMLLGEIIDYAIRRMSQAYVSGTTRRAQVDEAYRLVSLGQDVSIERESQRAALMEWSQSVLFGLFGSARGVHLEQISQSTFGLWLRHRAGMMFQGSPSLQSVEDAVQQIDSVLLPKINEARSSGNDQLQEAVGRLQTTIEEIKYLLGDLFQSVAGMENARDPLTKTLNRRFLPSILSREISLANSSRTAFTLLMIDVDHFKQINDKWGHAAGDVVLHQIAEVIMDNVRLSDFVFRYGGEEFLVALVETPEERGAEIAERIRSQFVARPLQLPDGSVLTSTVSIGVAGHRGHPDYAHLIDIADKALYRAKAAGRDRIELGAVEGVA